ncbi:hypothetical protein T484DRAFT_3001745 [Baffinella frigidus]|nr:hypothetical protein T484DRAFT_3001745 [Cryptophyta sp. CCMP2293]
MDLSFMEDQGIDNIQEFNPIVVDPAKLDLLHSDREVHWLLNNFDGDMFSAFGLVLTIFHEETTTMIDEVHVEIRLLFSVYIVSIILLFYVSLFRRTCNAADAQAIRSREFVSMMPIYILSKTDANMVVQFFTPENDAEHDHRLSAKNLFENVDPAEKGDKEDKATEGGKRTTFHDHASKPHSYSEARDGQGLLLKGNSSSL